MSKLVLQPTATAEWHSLIEEAQNSLNLRLDEEMESYLIFLLMRFTSQTHIAQSILALEFIQSLQEYRNARESGLRDVGDKCLLFAGLFPGRAQKRQVNVSYFVNLGQSAYSEVANTTSNSISGLFSNLSLTFIELMEVLNATRTLQNNNLDLLQAEELWSELGSAANFKKIFDATGCIPIQNTNNRQH